MRGVNSKVLIGREEKGRLRERRPQKGKPELKDPGKSTVLYMRQVCPL
jgi:hypothetical protein